eukprot:gene11080-3786_t
MRMCDPRTKDKIVNQGMSHEGLKAGNVTWLSTNDKIVTSGFTKIYQRELKFVQSTIIDNGSSTLMLYQDESFLHVYAIGKGEYHLRHFDIEKEDVLFHLNNQILGYKGIQAASLFPKRIVDISKCELNRFLVATNEFAFP